MSQVPRKPKQATLSQEHVINLTNITNNAPIIGTTRFKYMEITYAPKVYTEITVPPKTYTQQLDAK